MPVVTVYVRTSRYTHEFMEAEEEKKKAEEEKAAANTDQGSAAGASGEVPQGAPEDSIPYNKVDSIQVRYSFAHAQFHNDVVYLGNGEKTTIDIIATPADLTLDDFIIY